ncbi:Retrotrans gag domain-containing protein [Abeliophyllum distichum]|uniref:Retrotrans gag domain-containing protein n=1 Tax=Abeliophyllum distichum TaxID=126358 RepID=A0ABD1R9U0_9LAMI
MGLMQVIQDKGETLREYMSRFNRATLGIKNLQMPSVVTALLSGLRNHSFRASLSKKPPESMTELLRRGEEYIDQEEVLKSTRVDREPYEGGSRKRQRAEHMSNKPNTRLMTEYKYRPVGETVNAISQVQLNAPLSTILREISSMKELRWPEKLRSDPSIRDRSRTCWPERGFLKHFVKRYGNHHKEIPEDAGQKRRAGVINVICGGSAGGGDSRNSRKGYARSLQVNAIAVPSRFNQSITFDDEDLHGVSLPHDDALVITGDIADFDVKRVLVDTGSAANVLSWDAFAALKVSADVLKPVNTLLQGFGGGIVIPEGVVDLPVVLGRYPCCISLVTPFLVVRAPMAYNSIYGRPIINAVGAVISTQHQCMKFPTGRGIGVVKGDQLTSRRCYVDSIRAEVNPISEVKPTSSETKKKDNEQTSRFEPADEVEVVSLEENKCIKIGRSLSAEDRNEMIDVLRENLEAFAWGPGDLPGD